MQLGFFLAVALTLPGQPSGREDAKKLIDAIEALQKPIEDFRCEFESSTRFLGQSAVNEQERIDSEGYSSRTAGSFVWRRGGDTHCDLLARDVSPARIRRETLIVRMSADRAERHQKTNDRTVPHVESSSVKDGRFEVFDSPRQLFVIDQLKRYVSQPEWNVSVGDETIEGRKFKVLSVTMADVPNGFPFIRYWIDMDRGGHATRIENYLDDPSLGERSVASRTRIELAKVKVGDSDLWMPVSRESTGHVALFDRQPRHTDTPATIQTIKIIDGTLAFNKRPGPEVFQATYRLPAPTSPVLRQLWRDYDAQGAANRAARSPNSPPVPAGLGLLAEPTEGRNWTLILIGLAGVGVVASLVVWLRQGR